MPGPDPESAIIAVMSAGAIVGAGLTAALGLVYRSRWIRLHGHERTPTGFGLLLAPAMLAAAWLAETSQQLILALAVTAAATFAYWFDDLRELSARLRIAISFASGIAIGGIYLVAADFPPIAIVGLALFAGFVNVALVNMVNFQDGADLNLATFMLLTGGLLLITMPGEREWTAVAVACLAFTLPFAVMNSRPRTIYLGDSGSFAFATLFTIMGAAFLAGPVMPPPEAAIPAALPAIDAAFVTALRIRIRQPFTTRHYFHLYQRLQRSHAGFGYLAPQPVNVGLCLLASALLQALGLGRVLSVALAMIVMTVPFFFACRRFFVVGEPGPPQPRTTRA